MRTESQWNKVAFYPLKWYKNTKSEILAEKYEWWTQIKYTSSDFSPPVSVVSYYQIWQRLWWQTWNLYHFKMLNKSNTQSEARGCLAIFIASSSVRRPPSTHTHAHESQPFWSIFEFATSWNGNTFRVKWNVQKCSTNEIRQVKDVERMENRINWMYITMCRNVCVLLQMRVYSVEREREKYKIVMKFDRGKMDKNRIVMIQL